MDRIINKIISRIYSICICRRLRSCGEHALFHFRARTLQGLKYVSIGSKTVFGKWACLTAWDSYCGESFSPEIIIGSNCHFGDHCHITSCHGIKIGDNLLTGRNVLITDNSHGVFDSKTLDMSPIERPLFSKGKVVVGNNVWLGSNVCIMPGVTIGNGAVVAANSVVTRNVPPKTMVGGVPAGIIKSICLSEDK